MNGNPHYKNAVYIDRDVQLRQVDALLVIAHELRTANIIALQSTPGWLDDARARLGHPTAPGTDFTMSQAKKELLMQGVPPEQLDQRCSKHLMDGRNEIRCWLPANHEGDCK
jgi:hypothetical protein